MSEPAAKRPSHSESYKGLFHSVFPGLVKELTEDGLSNPEIADGVKHLKEVLNFNVPNGMSLCNIVLCFMSPTPLRQMQPWADGDWLFETPDCQQGTDQ